MPYIARKDGEHFVIPSYRDVLSAKKGSLLKREILLLSSNYGDYITLQKKNVDQYEIAFSNEPGVLLGETIWQYFNRPRDLIYCEIQPEGTEAILVIVKSGSVYLDGSFPVDSIVEELIIFKTQQVHFDIYIYGDVPISQAPEEGKFSFDAVSVNSFTRLDKPVFEKLPVLKIFQLQRVETVLRQQGIGVFPLKRTILILGAAGALWASWESIVSYLNSKNYQSVLPQAFIQTTNPYQQYLNALASPDPVSQIHRIAEYIGLFFTVPGWYPVSFNYTADGDTLVVPLQSLGARTYTLYHWAQKNGIKVGINQQGFYVTAQLQVSNRAPLSVIYRLDEVVASFIDRLSYLLPGNSVTVGSYVNKGKFSETEFSIKFDNISVDTLAILGQQLKALPLILSKVEVTVTNGSLSGSIVLKALGN